MGLPLSDVYGFQSSVIVKVKEVVP